MIPAKPSIPLCRSVNPVARYTFLNPLLSLSISDYSQKCTEKGGRSLVGDFQSEGVSTSDYDRGFML